MIWVAGFFNIEVNGIRGFDWLMMVDEANWKELILFESKSEDGEVRNICWEKMRMNIEKKRNIRTFFPYERSFVGGWSSCSISRSFCKPRVSNVGLGDELSSISLVPSLKFFVKNPKDGLGKGVCLRYVFMLNIVAFVWLPIYNFKLNG